MKMLKFKDFVDFIEINEATISDHLGVPYMINPSNEKNWPKELIDYTYINYPIKSPRSIKELLQNATNVFYSVKGSSIVKKINITDVESMLKDRDNTLMKTVDESNVYLIVGPKSTTLLTMVKDESATSTNIKEGMVVYFYYSNINDIPNQHNARQIISTLLKDVGPTISSESLDKDSIKEITEYLTNLPMNKKTLSNLIDYWSSANLIKNKLGGNSYIVSRNTIFDSIRTLGSKLSKFQADKWCPGDIYLIDPNVIKEIPKYIDEISKNIQLDSIAKLNLLFKNEFENKITEGDPIIGSIIAISLKQEKAQGGKAKQFMKSLTKDDKEYNVTKDEQKLPTDSLIKAIENYRKIIADSCSKSGITIDLTQDSGYTGDGDEDTIRKKYASIKLAHKLLADPDSIDDNLLKGCAFGMSLTGVNPTFFKVIGNTKGVATEDKFPAGEKIELMDHGINDKRTHITILDRNSNASIIFRFTIRKTTANVDKPIQFTCKPNGNVQATLEIEK